jgi:hypothetical protein
MIQSETKYSSAVLLTTLQAELEFLEKGGYHQLAPKWYAPLIFEEGPHSSQLTQGTGHKSPLLEFVPRKDRQKPLPWRHIVLTKDGETLETLYRTATQREIEENLRGWLTRQIDELQGSSVEIDEVEMNEQAELVVQ